MFSLETYNLYSIASQLKRLFDPMTIGISRTGDLSNKKNHNKNNNNNNHSYFIQFARDTNLHKKIKKGSFVFNQRHVSKHNLKKFDCGRAGKKGTKSNLRGPP